MIKDRAIGRLEEDVSARVAEVEFLADLLFQIICRVLRFPETVGKVELIKQSAVGSQRRFASA